MSLILRLPVSEETDDEESDDGESDDGDGSITLIIALSVVIGKKTTFRNIWKKITVSLHFKIKIIHSILLKI